jgi:hypothetical protein
MNKIAGDDEKKYKQPCLSLSEHATRLGTQHFTVIQNIVLYLSILLHSKNSLIINFRPLCNNFNDFFLFCSLVMYTKTLPLTATKEMFQVLALYSITKIRACEYKDIAAKCYKINVPSFGTKQQLNVFNKS